MMNFKGRPLFRNIVVYTIIGVVGLFAFFDFAGLLGISITITVIYLIITSIYHFFNPQPVLQRQETDEEHYERWQEMDAHDSFIKEEERINQENIANQEALDRLL